MKNVLKIVSVYLGAIIGAGFASGQEIEIFFTSQGSLSIIGIIISPIIMGIFLYKALCNLEDNYYNFLFRLTGNKFISLTLEILAYFFIISVFCIMLSGNGALLNQNFGFPNFIGIVLMAAICLVIFLLDIKGFIVFNMIFSPVLVIGLTFSGIISLLNYNIETFAGIERYKFIFYTLIYISYNTFTLIPVLTPLRGFVKNRKTALLSSIIGTLCLLLISVIIWINLILFKNTGNLEIPLLSITNSHLYVFILFLAMLTTAVSGGFSVINNFKLKKLSIIIFVILCCIFAGIGFSNLISSVYTFFGLLGLYILFLVLKKM